MCYTYGTLWTLFPVLATMDYRSGIYASTRVCEYARTRSMVARIATYAATYTKRWNSVRAMVTCHKSDSREIAG